MRSSSAAGRCGRFIREFNADYVRKFGFGIGAKLVVVAEGLAFDEHDRIVRYRVTVRPEGTEEEIRFSLDPVFYAPEALADAQLAQVTDDLELDAAEVQRRLRRAGLVGRRTG